MKFLWWIAPANIFLAKCSVEEQKPEEFRIKIRSTVCIMSQINHWNCLIKYSWVFRTWSVLWNTCLAPDYEFTVRIYAKSQIFLWDDLLALKMDQYLFEIKLTNRWTLSTAVSLFPQSSLVEPSPLLVCGALLNSHRKADLSPWQGEAPWPKLQTFLSFLRWSAVLYTSNTVMGKEVTSWLWVLFCYS